MRYNLHTHSFYCGHGSGRIDEYAEEAQRNGFEVLGFSEHCPFPDGLLSRSRMPYSSMAQYEADVRNERRPFDILLGYEVDYFRRFDGYYESLRNRVDYLIGGTHFIFRPDGTMSSVFDGNLSASDLSIYADTTIKAMESGFFSFYAHPDAFLSSCQFNSEARAVSIAIIEASIGLSIPLEINGNGYLRKRGYPSREFWELAAERDVPAILSSDAHRTQDLAAPFPGLREFAADLGISILCPSSLHPLSFRKEQGK